MSEALIIIEITLLIIMFPRHRRKSYWGLMSVQHLHVITFFIKLYYHKFKFIIKLLQLQFYTIQLNKKNGNHERSHTKHLS